MILNRHLRALLRRLGLDEKAPPTAAHWVALLSYLNDHFRTTEEEKHRLTRSLEIHGREVQSLYKELVQERERLSSALACLDIGFIIFDKAGQVSLMNAEAEQYLGFSESESLQKNFLQHLGLEPAGQAGSLQQLLSAGQSVNRRQILRTKSGQPYETHIQLQPVLREGHLVGSVLTFETPASRGSNLTMQSAPESSLQELLENFLVKAADWLDEDGSGHLEAIVERTQEALASGFEPIGRPTQEDLVPVLEPAYHAAPAVTSAAAAPPPPLTPRRPEAPKPAESLPPTPPVPEAPPVVEVAKTVDVVRPASAPPGKEEVPETREAPAAPRTGDGLRVLLVEDEPVSQMVTQSHLEKLGHECTVASDANEAIRLYQRQPFDAIISSYLMPGMNGIDLCRKIREDSRGGYSYFILLTAVERKEEASRALEAGVDAFLTKPLDPNELAVRLKVAKGVQSRLSRVYSDLPASE